MGQVYLNMDRKCAENWLQLQARLRCGTIVSAAKQSLCGQLNENNCLRSQSSVSCWSEILFSLSVIRTVLIGPLTIWQPLVILTLPDRSFFINILSSQHKIWWTSCHYIKRNVVLNFEHYQYMLHIYSSTFFVLTSVTSKFKVIALGLAQNFMEGMKSV
jgi:hypothetical protein